MPLTLALGCLLVVRFVLAALPSPGFHRLAEAVTFAVHLKNVAAVRQTVQQRRRHAFALEHLAPVAEGQVARDQQTLAFIAIREHLEEKFGPAAAERQVTEFVADDEIGPVELAQESVELALLLGLFQAIDQASRGEETDAISEPARSQSQRGGQVRFAGARLADKNRVGTLLEPVAAGQLQDLRFAQARHGGEIVGVKVLVDREARLFDAGLEHIGRAGRHLQFGQT